MHIQSTLGISSNLKLQFLLCCSVVSAGRTILSVVRVVIDHSCRPPAQLAVDCGEGWPPRSNPSAAILLVTWQGSDLVVNWCFGIPICDLVIGFVIIPDLGILCFGPSHVLRFVSRAISSVVSLLYRRLRGCLYDIVIDNLLDKILVFAASISSSSSDPSHRL